MSEQRFLLTVGYQAGPDPRIQRGADGYRDYFTPEELEKAAWSLLRSGAPTCGLFHVDGTEGAAEIVESSIWRAPDPWVLKAVDGSTVAVNPGDWLVGLVCDERAWGLYKSGRVAGISPQGAAKRRRAVIPGSGITKAALIAKSTGADLDEDEMTELYDAQVPRLDLVGKGANGMPFLIAKSADGSPGGLFDADYVRELIAKASPDADTRETVTMTGSAAAIAALIHGAPVRKTTPADPDTYEALVKAKYNAGDLKRMAANGQAMDDASYPIADKEDLARAIRAVGRGGSSHDAIRRHILARAKALGASSEIPDNWGADGSLKKETAMADDLDPTTALAEPDGDAPGMDTDPGSPAWEAIDAATARKWTAILARAKSAIDMLADREMLEAASADPGDAEHAFDLQDACCAIDYAIGVLAPFAVAEQAEADCASEMETLGKALAGFDVAPLELIEGLVPLAKAGRVLSSANEAAIRGAVESLQKVLASLPQAPTADDEGGRAVAKTANEESDMPTPTTSSEATDQSGQAAAMGSTQPDPKPEAGVPVTEVGKADGEKTPMVVVYDQKGRLIGIVDPQDVTPVANAEADADDMDEAQDGDSGAEQGEPDADDLTPEPPAQAGTPADAVPDGVAKTTHTDTDTVLKSIAGFEQRLAEHSAHHDEQVAKQGADLAAVAEIAKSLAERVKALEEQEAVSKVFTNGAVPPAQLRGQDRGAPAVGVTKAMEMRAAFRDADPAEQNRIAKQMQEAAIDRLAAIHGNR